MRTKTLLLTAAFAVASVATSMADVFSVNVVGYVNVTIRGGTAGAGKFTLVANPLTATSNTVLALFPNPPDKLTVYKFLGSGGYSINAFEFGAWADPAQTFLPGEGFFVKNEAPVFTNTFVGEVSQGVLTNPVPANFSLKGSIVPQTGSLQTLLGYIPGEGDTVYKLNNAGTYDIIPFEFGAWAGDTNGPNINVGEGFFLRNPNAAKNWVRTFTVN